MTKIEWVRDPDTGIQGKTWNPIVGCSKVSPGCANCYAETMAKRLKAMGRPEYQEVINGNGKWTGEVTLVPERLDQPLRWRKPRMVFVNSMSDLFHEDVPDEIIGDIWAVMREASHHTFQVLTKRPERMLRWVNEYWKPVLDNVWPGVSIEDQKTANQRIPVLLQIPGTRFVSAEPLLGPINLTVQDDWMYCKGHFEAVRWKTCFCAIDWLIIGGESGPRARPMNITWARLLRDQARAAGVPFFFKQHGEWAAHSQIPLNDIPAKLPKVHMFDDGIGVFRFGKKRAGRLLDGREWNEYPKLT